MTNQLEIKIDKMQKLYEEIKKELCKKIGNKEIDLVDRYESGEEDVFTYFIGSDQYDVQSVTVGYYNGTHKLEDAFLHFQVNLVYVDTEGYVQYLEDAHTLQDIPYEFAIQLLELVYDKVIGENN